jgi:DNA invertase Pin-like site-specific DNA recombinase
VPSALIRLGRNYLEVGYYTEIKFREKGVRFIAIGNSVDSAVQGSSEFVPFLNIVNEWYLRDCSRKIRASVTAKGNSGKHISSQVVYGYKKDPEDGSLDHRRGGGGCGAPHLPDDH